MLGNNLLCGVKLFLYYIMRKATRGSRFFCFEYVFRLFVIDYMLNKSLCIQVQILDEIKSLCYNKHN